MRTEVIVTEIDALIDQIDQLLGDLPLRNDKRKRLSGLLLAFFAELEDETEMMSSDWEA